MSAFLQQLSIDFPVPPQAADYPRRLRTAAMVTSVRRDVVERASALLRIAASGRVLTRWEEAALEPYLAALACAAEDPDVMAAIEEVAKNRRQDS